MPIPGKSLQNVSQRLLHFQYKICFPFYMVQALTYSAKSRSSICGFGKTGVFRVFRSRPPGMV